MPQLQSYLKQEVPREIAIQISCGIRFVWPQLFAGTTKLAAVPRVVAERQTFVMMDDELLMSHAEANIREVEHLGERYRVGGLSAVFAYPNYRGVGAGEKVVAAASEFLRKSSTDFALLFCGERVHSLYLRQGWERCGEIVVQYGDAAKPQMYGDGWLMGMFVSQRGREARKNLEGTPLYVGSNTW